jgi:hypothetical protein
MALINCKECKAEISDSAKTCPKCGAPVPQPTSRFTLLVGGLLLIGVLSAVFRGNDSSTAPAPTQAAAPLSPEMQRAEDDRKRSEALAQQRRLVATAAAGAIKASLRDPDSLVIESLGVSVDAKVACATYRARNGFGGMNREQMAFIDGNATQDAKLMNRHCDGLLEMRL